MWVDGSLVCSSSGRNTSAYGDVSVVQIGLAELYGCRATTVYGDCVELAGAYVGPEPKAASSLSMSLLRNPVTPKVGTDITGSLAPERPNSDISVKYRVLGGSESWTTLATVKTNANSRYVFSWIPAAVGSYELKASWAGDAETLPADSPVSRLDCVNVSTKVSISTSSSSTMVGLRVSIAGRLVDQYGDALRNEVVVLHYTFSGISGWVPITSASTNSDGNYSMTWIPTATGYYSLRAEWAGNATHGSATANATLSSISYADQYVFTVESNSSTSQLAFNETDRSLRFSATGPDGTRGFARVNVAKNMVNDPSRMKVYVDGAERSFMTSSVDDSWLLAFDYTHSTHQVMVDLDITIVPEFPGLIVIPLVMMATLLVTILSKKRTSNGEVSQ
jgi:hypothetical protein